MFTQTLYKDILKHEFCLKKTVDKKDNNVSHKNKLNNIFNENNFTLPGAN